MVYFLIVSIILIVLVCAIGMKAQKNYNPPVQNKDDFILITGKVNNR